MSGGKFNYDQYRLKTIADTIQSTIDNNTQKHKWGIADNFSEDTLTVFKQAIKVLKRAEIYTQRIDWLLSGDDSEETFHKRLKEELNDILH